MNVLVTGATGHVGQFVVRHLLARGAHVVAMTRNRDRATQILPPEVGIIEADLTDPGSLVGAFDGIDAAHLISFTGEDNQPINHAADIVQAMARAGVRYATLLKGNISPCPLDRELSRSTIPFTRLAPVEFMDNALWWAPEVRSGTVAEGFVDVPSTVVHDSDIGEVAAAQLVGRTRPGEDLWITGGEALTPRQRLAIIAEEVGRPVALVELSDAQVAEKWSRAGMDDEGVAFLLGMRRNPPHHSRHPTDTVRRLTGHDPITFRTFVRQHRADFSHDGIGTHL